jgi:phenylalanine ammonia-lyase
MLVEATDTQKAGLYQDRYTLRTASQWIGPQLEDLSHAQEQLAVELNSSTDNPLIDADGCLIHHGGNFQAASVTSAMEKTRLSLQMLRKLMFAQSSELINPVLNKSLTPNLCFDDPSLSFTFKGVDINMAAYMSVLAFLANPVSSHVQSAEMHNQAVNSLALISARYTLDAVEVVSLMAATYLYCLCQALDLRSLHIEYLARIKKGAQAAFERTLNGIVPVFEMMAAFDQAFDAICAGLISSKTQDTPQRARATAEATVARVTAWLLPCREHNKGDALSAIDAWTRQLKEVVETSIRETRLIFASTEQGPTTLQYLGKGSTTLYRYIRHDLGIPLHKGLVEHPTYIDPTADGIVAAKEEKMTIGNRISVIYRALRSGDMHRPLIESLQSYVAAGVGLQDSSSERRME